MSACDVGIFRVSLVLVRAVRTLRVCVVVLLLLEQQLKSMHTHTHVRSPERFSYVLLTRFAGGLWCNTSQGLDSVSRLCVES